MGEAGKVTPGMISSKGNRKKEKGGSKSNSYRNLQRLPDKQTAKKSLLEKRDFQVSSDVQSRGK